MSATHGCRFRDDRLVECRCGWVSDSTDSAGVLESFDHFQAMAADREARR